jgi:flagellar biosynthesis GTPase FlhF
MDQGDITAPNMREARAQNLVTAASVGNHHTEAVSTEQEAVEQKWLPQISQDPHDAERAYVEVPNLFDSNSAEINIASAMAMAQIVQKARNVKPILITNYTHLCENRANEIQFLEHTCRNLFGEIDNLRRHQNHILVGINQAPPQTRLSAMHTWFRQMDSLTMHILANRIFLYNPLHQGTNNPDFWSRERLNEEIARMPCMPEIMALNLYRTRLTDHDSILLQQCLNHQVTALKNELSKNDHATVKHCWNFLKQLRALKTNAVVALSAQELLSMKLNDSTIALDTSDSAEVVSYCADVGQQNTAATTDKEAVTILGDTGAGKSTSVNCWVGCDMVLRTPKELEEMGIEGELEDVIVVHPDSECPGVASIGHGESSHTLIPQIIQDPNRATRVYIDCPGFLDNRGEEINIANAMNINHALRNASGVKAVFLASYPGLITNRGERIRNIENMCQQLFGGIDNLRRHQKSVLLGINRVSLQTNLNRIRTRLTQGGSPIMQILAQRTFLYDPLERGGADFWSRDRFLTEIEQMPAIPQRLAEKLFQTVLTGDDKAMLRRIVRHQVGAMSCALEQRDYPAADRCWHLLNQLRIIEHEEIDELMEGQVRLHMRAYAEERTTVFNGHAAQHDFTEAERLLALLRSLQAHFPDENLVDLEGLEATLQTAKEHYNAQQEAEKQAEAERQRAEAERQRAEAERQRAEAERQRAERLEQERRRAEEERQRARREREAMEEQMRRREAELEDLRRRRRPTAGVQVKIEVPCTIS